MISYLSQLAEVQTAVIFRSQPPQENPDGNVRGLAIRNLVASHPFHWYDLPRVMIHEKYLNYCLHPGDVVLPSRGDYYRAWLFEGAEEPVFPMGQLNVIRPGHKLDGRYLVWYLNQKSTQAKISLVLTGTNIKALTKSTLLMLGIALPPLPKQQQIAELDATTHQIIAIRHRLNELDKEEMTYLTNQILKGEAEHA